MKNFKSYNFRLLLISLFVLNFSLFVQAQQIPPKVIFPGTVENHKLKSKLMAREMPYRVILPHNYAKDNLKNVPVVYLLHGLTGHFNNWGDKTKVADYVSGYGYILVMAEGDDGWYSDSATVPNDKYESYIIQELIPEIDKKFRTKTLRSGRAVAGLSMGGYGAIKFGLKYPQMFSLTGSFSGALRATDWNDKNSREWLSKSIMSVFGEPSSPTRQSNDIYKIVREISDEKKKSLPFIYLDCGTEDFLIQNNRDFAALLFEKKIPHEFRQLPGKHDWNYWDSQIKEFMELTVKYLK